MVNYLTVLLLFVLVGVSFCFAKFNPKQSLSLDNFLYDAPIVTKVFNGQLLDSKAPSIIDAVATPPIKTVIANALGYVMGVGAIAVYFPILLKVVQKKDIEGLSVATWVFNLLGFTLAIAYPMKKGFPISTYMELLMTGLQSLVILGLVCQHNNKNMEFLSGIGLLAASFVAFMKTSNIPTQLLNGVQIAAMLLANYANIPQILVTFKRKKASWSGITAFMSMAGCAIRIFTTLQLTRDLLVMAGYILGFVTNGLLLTQVIIYRNA
jgi:mannose-P-dolichol utilization defect protein 1